MNELDRILSEEHAIAPPSGFSRRVMAEVHREASTPPPIPFPWRFAAATFAAMAVVLVACLFLSPLLPTWTVDGGAAIQRALSRIDPNLLAMSSTMVFAAVALLRYSLRFVSF